MRETTLKPLGSGQSQMTTDELADRLQEMQDFLRDAGSDEVLSRAVFYLGTIALGLHDRVRVLESASPVEAVGE